MWGSGKLKEKGYLLYSFRDLETNSPTKCLLLFGFLFLEVTLSELSRCIRTYVKATYLVNRKKNEFINGIIYIAIIG